MNEFNIKSYENIENAVNTAKTAKESIETTKDTTKECHTILSEETIFMGPIQEECIAQFDVINVKTDTITGNLETIASFLTQNIESYKKADEEAAKETEKVGENTEINNQSTSKKDINTSNVKKGTKVANALNKYGKELDNAEYATVNENLFTTTTTEYINGQPVEVTHIIINNPNQINGAPANGSYGSGLEKSSSAANRLNSTILINGSHFTSSGTEDLKGANNIVIVDNNIKHDGVSGGNELLLDNNGNIYNAYGKTAQQLVDDGVKYSFACHSTQVIENGDTSPSYREGRNYKRTIIGQAGPGEYYITTDTTYNNKLSDTAEYLKGKGCYNAYSLDQGGSVSLVRNDNLINNPSDSSGERAVGDFLYFV